MFLLFSMKNYLKLTNLTILCWIQSPVSCQIGLRTSWKLHSCNKYTELQVFDSVYKFLLRSFEQKNLKKELILFLFLIFYLIERLILRYRSVQNTWCLQVGNKKPFVYNILDAIRQFVTRFSFFVIFFNVTWSDVTSYIKQVRLQSANLVYKNKKTSIYMLRNVSSKSRSWSDGGGGVEDPPCIKIGYSSRLIPRAEKGPPAMY